MGFRRVLLLALTVAVAAVSAGAAYPPQYDLAPFLGSHWFYYEPTTRVIVEMYLKSNVSLDYHVWLGTVNGAQCVKDQMVDVVAIGDGMVRIGYEEPTGQISSHILDLGAPGLFKMFYRVSLYPAWLLNEQGAKNLTGCNQYDAACLTQILAWRTQGPMEPQTVAAGAPLPVLFVEQVAPGNDRLIDCADSFASPLVKALAQRTDEAMLAAHRVHTQLAAASKELRLPIAGFWYRYKYVNNDWVPGDLPTHDMLDLYMRNLTFFDMRLNTSIGIICSHVVGVAEPVRGGIWRLTWRGNHGRNFMTNLARPMQSWDMGQTFMGLTTPEVNPRDPHPYEHLYDAGLQWANVFAEEYRGVNNATAIGC